MKSSIKYYFNVVVLVDSPNNCTTSRSTIYIYIKYYDFIFHTSIKNNSNNNYFLSLFLHKVFIKKRNVFPLDV